MAIRGIFLYVMSAALWLQNGMAQTRNTRSDTDEELAQNIGETTVPAKQYEVMIIPFEPKLYRSEIDRDIANKTGLSGRQIKKRFRYGLAANMMAALQHRHSVVLMNETTPDLSADLAYIYKSIGYKYRPVQKEEILEKKSAASRLLEKISKKEQTPETTGAYIKEGQIANRPAHVERYMATSIINPNMLDYLSSKYGTSVYVFINQLDMLGASENDYRDYAAEDYKRIIKVHYTVLDASGKECMGGAIKYYFSSRINDMNVIIKEMFADIANSISEHISFNTPALNLKTEEEKKAENQEKKLMRQY